MIGLLEEIKDGKQVSFESEELDLDDAVNGDEQILPERSGPAGARKLELGEDSLNLYFADVGRTSLLADGETSALSRQIEDGRHLVRVEREVAGEMGCQPSAAEVTSALLDRLIRCQPLFEALCRHLALPSYDDIGQSMMHPGLRAAVDDRIDPHLSAAVAELIGISKDMAEKAIVEMSLDNRLVPWNIVDDVCHAGSLAELGETVHLPEFYDELGTRAPDIARHFEQIRERARLATDRMVQANLRLVVGVAKGHMGWGVPMADLIQEGNIGLMHAVRKFDHRRGFRFSTYAVPWIWQAVNRAANDQSRVVRLPGYLVDDLTKLTRVRTGLLQRLGRQPTEEELASEMGLPPERVELLLKLGSSAPISYETPVGEEGARLGDLIADRAASRPEDEADAILLKEELSTALESLTRREQRVIELRFGLDGERSRTLKEAGEELGLTKERVRQIEKRALAKLRHPTHSRELIGYLG